MTPSRMLAATRNAAATFAPDEMPTSKPSSLAGSDSLYQALFSILVRQGCVQALAAITLPNPASVALHESVGFRPLGTFQKVGFKRGRWHDVGWWQAQLQDPPATPSEPRPLPTLLLDL